MKSKPFPPLRSLEKRETEEREEEEEGEMEMKELVTSTEEDKDDYYFEDPSNISKSLFSYYMFIYYVLFSVNSS